MDERFALNDATLSVLGAGSCVTFGDIDVFHKNALFFLIHLQDLADFTLVLSGDDLDLVIFFDEKLLFHVASPFPWVTIR